MTGIRAYHINVLLFALGIVGAQFFPRLIPAWLCVLATAAAASGWAIPAFRPLVVLLTGALWALFRADLTLGTAWPSELESRDVVVAGKIAGLPQHAARYLKFDFDVEQVRFDEQPVAFAGRIRLRWYDPPASAAAGLKAGSTWRVTVRLKQPHGYYNPGGFDYEAYLYREGIRATGYVRHANTNARLSKPGRISLQSIRQRLRDRLDAGLQDARLPGLLRALALGDRSSISDAQWNTLRKTGTSHLMAISGLHVGFVAGIGALLGLWVGRVATLVAPTFAAPQSSAVAALCLAFVYAALSGFDVPAQRAFVMAAVFLLGVLCRRHAWNARGLCTALLVVLIINPASVHDPGLWLSFCAVALILGWLARGGQGTSATGTLLEAVKLQWVLSLGLVPLVAAFFGVASLIAAPANLLAVPVVMFVVVPLCLLGVVSVALGASSVAAYGLAGADAALAALWAVLSALGDLGHASVPLQLEVWQALVIMGGMIWAMVGKTRFRKWGWLCGAVLLAPGPSAPDHGEFRVVVLDVGQGLSAVVTTAHHALVYDTGPRYPSGFSLAETVVIPYLRSRSVKEIDILIVSHGDNDHRGGFEDLDAALPIGRALSSVAGELPGAVPCLRGQRWQWDGVVLEMLHPDDAHPFPGNNASCVLRIAGPYGSALLTGDIESQAEIALRRRSGARLRSDVLLVPHQGSATSSSGSFIDAVDPSWAVVSAGYLNRYGHPHPDVIARYAQRGIKIKTTASSGAVTAELTRDGISLSGWRETRQRYWLDGSDRTHAKDAI